ncbi:hypothetical protein [Amycolatopsis sp. WQ 127309]|uniref:hypothetical protein n=1 Tax=Amycolatopsis sp. WQ 127309 TaxID=2932773 RepID=UPI001FF456F0|nr:hypothetical protein [Amycolatopsis sp. WQ 127309]UOZ06991.1 hypothetical protein MUY22_01465 [Amycolatopsis sp. WQ 127309]
MPTLSEAHSLDEESCVRHVFAGTRTLPRETCAEVLTPVPLDTEHAGWVCVLPAGHLTDRDHRAQDGMTW